MPTITHADLTARLHDLKKQAELFRQQYNMTLGAIAECEYWLSQVTPQETDHGR